MLEEGSALRFSKLFEAYYNTLGKRVVKEHGKLQDQDRRNHEAYIKSGHIFEDRQQSYDKMSKSFEKTLEQTKALAELLGLPPPALSEDKKGAGPSLAINLDPQSRANDSRHDEEIASGKSPWEDEDTRRFYQSLVDLADMIPPSVLGDLTRDGAAGDVKMVEGQSVAPAARSAEMSQRSDQTDREDESTAGSLSQLNSLLVKLPDLTNRTMIDSAAVDFVFMNSKPSRRKLVKTLAAAIDLVGRGRLQGFWREGVQTPLVQSDHAALPGSARSFTNRFSKCKSTWRRC